MAVSGDGAAFLQASRLRDAGRGNAQALFELGVACSTNTDDSGIDLIEAHKWFNLAAMQGHDDAAACRADISEDMTAREIATAQREARAWLQASERRAA